MSIWYANPSISEINAGRLGSMAAHIGLEVTEIGDDFLRGTLPVDERTTQPYGILHGGASVALAETLASLGAWLTVDPDTTLAVGVDINASHVRSVPSGQQVTGTARPLHRGRTGQVWQVDIEDPQGRLVCTCRMTARLLERRS